MKYEVFEYATNPSFTGFQSVTRLFALLRAFERAQKMQFGELILYVPAGKITRYEINKSRLNEGAQQANEDVLKDVGDFETISI